MTMIQSPIIPLPGSSSSEDKNNNNAPIIKNSDTPPSPLNSSTMMQQQQNQQQTPSAIVRQHYISNYCCDAEVQKVMTVQMMCGNDNDSKCQKWTFWANYFGFWSHLGSGPFYILLLCLFAWTGHPLFAAYLCVSLSATLYTTDIIKDILALPRPPSPPVLRGGTASHALEYGFPSTHTACACVLAHLMARYFLEHLNDPFGELFLTKDHQQMMNHHHDHDSSTNHTNNNSNTVFWVIFLALFFVIHVSVSRMYLGLHWYGDVLGGLGVYFSWAVCDWLFLRSFVTYALGNVPLLSTASSSFLFSLVQLFVWIFFPLILGVWLIELHATPRDACPCFEDSVRFVGADCGLLLGSWTTILYYYFNSFYFTTANSNNDHHHQSPTTSSAAVPTGTGNTLISQQQQKYFVQSDFGVPSFTLAGFSNPIVLVVMYLAGVVLLILAQEISVKYLIPPVLKPVLRYLSGNNNNATTSKAYKTFVWFIGAVIFLRIPYLNKFLMSSHSLKNYKHHNTIATSNEQFSPSFEQSNNNNENNSEVGQHHQQKNDEDFVKKEEENGAEVVKVNQETTVVTVVNNNNNSSKEDEIIKEEGNNNNNNSNTEQSSSSSNNNTTTLSTAWTLRCHTHWNEENIQAKFLSYVVLGFCASFVWPQYLFPGITKTWSDLTEFTNY